MSSPDPRPRKAPAAGTLSKEKIGCCRTTGIGSLPHRSSAEAVDFLLQSDLSIPFWPQLPRRRFMEQMVPQYSEGMPCVRVEEDAKRVACELEGKYKDLEKFLEAFLCEDPASWRASTRTWRSSSRPSFARTLRASP